MRDGTTQRQDRSRWRARYAVQLVVAASLVVPVFAAGATAQEAEDDPATADVSGEWLNTNTVTKVRRTGSFTGANTFPGQTGTNRVTLTDDGQVVVDGVPDVSFSRSGATMTYSRRIPEGVGCIDENGEVTGQTGPAFSEFTLQIEEVVDGVAQRLSSKSVARWPAPFCENPGSMIAHRVGEWVRIDGAAAVATSRDGSVTYAVTVEADPLEVAPGDAVSVPVTVSGIATALEQPCNVAKPLDRPMTLEQVVLASSGDKRMLGTGKKPLNPSGTTIQVGSPLETTTDEPSRCSYRMVAEVLASITIPEDTAPGRYPLIPVISGLPRAAAVDSGRLVLTVVAAPAPEPTEAEDIATAAPAVPPPADIEPILLADSAGDVGGRAALLAILSGAAAAMFTRMRGRRLRGTGIFAGFVAIGGGAVELVAGGLLGAVDVTRHLASGAFSMVTGAAMAGGFLFFLPWLSRPDRDDRRAGPLIPVLLAIWVFALRALDGVPVGRAALAGGIALVIGLLAVFGASRTRARVFGLVAGFALMVLTYMGAVVRDGSGTSGRTEAIIALALGGAAVLVAAVLPKTKTDGTAPESDAAVPATASADTPPAP